MKSSLLFLLLILSGLTGYSQIICQELPTITYRQPVENDFEQVGSRIIFTQRCDPGVDSIVTNGSVLFEKTIIRDIKGTLLVTFENNILTKFFFQTKSKAESAKLIEYAKANYSTISCTYFNKTYYMTWITQYDGRAVFHSVRYDGKSATYVVI